LLNMLSDSIAGPANVCVSNIQQARRQKLSRSENQALSHRKRIKF
jgi:hypothetical protein